jgi:hypothetical protein
MDTNRPEPPFPKQKQQMPGRTAAMKPVPDHGEDTYKGSGRLKDKKAIITGGDSGIGRPLVASSKRVRGSTSARQAGSRTGSRRNPQNFAR